MLGRILAPPLRVAPGGRCPPPPPRYATAIIDTNLNLFYLILYCKICSSVRPFEWYTLNGYHVMGNGENCILVEKRKNTFHIGFNF